MYEVVSWFDKRNFSECFGTLERTGKDIELIRNVVNQDGHSMTINPDLLYYRENGKIKTSFAKIGKKKTEEELISTTHRVVGTSFTLTGAKHMINSWIE